MLKSLDAKGMIDPDTGLLGQEAFWRDLNRAVGDAERRGVGLSIARFSFNGSDRRSGLDAARLLSRLMRQVDFACREADNSIFAVFTDTDLRAAHVVARRLASILKNTTMAPDRKRVGIDAAVTLATLRPNDNVDSLIARVVGKRRRLSGTWRLSAAGELNSQPAGTWASLRAANEFEGIFHGAVRRAAGHPC